MQSALRLRPDLDRRSHRNQIPYLIDLFVSDRDATQCPVVESMRSTQPLHAIRESVDHDGAARWDTEFGRAFAVVHAGIGDMERPVIMAIRIARVNHIMAFRRPRVPFSLLGRKTAPSQGNFVGSDDLAVSQQFKNVVLLQDQN